MPTWRLHHIGAWAESCRESVQLIEIYGTVLSLWASVSRTSNLEDCNWMRMNRLPPGAELADGYGATRRHTLNQLVAGVDARLGPWIQGGVP